MSIDIRPAENEAQREAIFRLRYEIYVEEMGRYRTIADHEKAVLIEPEDETGRQYCALDESGTVVGAMRLMWGGDAPFNERIVEQYDLKPFLERMDADRIIVGERFMVAPAHRGSDLIFRMFQAYLRLVNEKRIELIFGDCEPHLLNLYMGMGFRTYTRKNVNSKDTGYLIPLVMVAEDIDYFREIGSPFAEILTDFGDEKRVPDFLGDMLSSGSAVMSEKLTGLEQYSTSVLEALNTLSANRPLLFDGMSEEQVDICLAKSNVIDCREGDYLIKRGNTAQNIYVALSGTLEARDGNVVTGVITAGDVFGEVAFLLNTPRTMDVFAATDDVKVLSLSESTIRDIMQSDPECAAALLLNMSKMLCLKLLDRRH